MSSHEIFALTHGLQAPERKPDDVETEYLRAIRYAEDTGDEYHARLLAFALDQYRRFAYPSA